MMPFRMLYLVFVNRACSNADMHSNAEVSVPRVALEKRLCAKRVRKFSRVAGPARFISVLAVVLTVATSSGCGTTPKLVSEADMKDPDKRAELARKNVAVINNSHPKVSKVAIIGVNASRFPGSNTKHVSRFDPSESFRRSAGAISSNVAAAKQLTCKALDSVFDDLQPALDAAGFHTVSVVDTLNGDAYRSLLENRGGSLMCVADKARVSIASIIWHGFRSEDRALKFQSELVKLMDATGVDGALVALLASEGMVVEESTLVLLARQADGSLHTAWQAKLKKDSMRFETVVKKPRGDDDRVQNIVRVYKHSFAILATKLAQDAKQ